MDQAMNRLHSQIRTPWNSNNALLEFHWVRIRTFPYRVENNHAYKWISENFPRILTYLLFLESFLKSICMHGFSPIHVEMSIFFLKAGDWFVPSIWFFYGSVHMDFRITMHANGFLTTFQEKAFLESCQKSICMYCCCPIHVERS